MNSKQQQGDGIERMLDAWTNAKDQDFSGTHRDCYDCMTAAAKVCTDARDAQWEKAIIDELHDVSAKPLSYCLTVIKGCRARILHAQPEGKQ